MALTRLPLDAPAAGDVVVETLWSGISAGTERLLFTGPDAAISRAWAIRSFPATRASARWSRRARKPGSRSAPRSSCPARAASAPVRGLHRRRRFASRRAGFARRAGPGRARRKGRAAGAGGDRFPRAQRARRPATASSSSATACSAACSRASRSRSGGAPPVVWEKNAARRARRGRLRGDVARTTTSAATTATIFDVSGDPRDPRFARAAARRRAARSCSPASTIALSFAFPPAFMREARIRVAAQWREGDLAEVVRARRSRAALARRPHHPSPPGGRGAPPAYPIAFDDPVCLKMVLDWRSRS